LSSLLAAVLQFFFFYADLYRIDFKEKVLTVYEPLPKGTLPLPIPIPIRFNINECRKWRNCHESLPTKETQEAS